MALVEIPGTKNYSVYATNEGSFTKGRFYFEHHEHGENRSATAIVDGNEVVDLDGCYCLDHEQVDFLRARGIKVENCTADDY